MDLVKVRENTYYIKNPTNIGVFKVDDNGGVFLIDSGNDKDAGKKILKLLEAEGMRVRGIISTHSNADHIGGNKVIQDRCGCPIYACGAERYIGEIPILEPSFLYGGFPFKELKNKFLMAKESKIEDINGNLPRGLEMIRLPGHFFDMIGIRTPEEVYFLGDSLFSRETIEKYHLFFIYDVAGYLDTLNMLENLGDDDTAPLFIASHCEATEDIHPLIRLNRAKIYEIGDAIVFFCGKGDGSTFEEILKFLFDKYELVMNPGQYVLVGSTVRSYLSWLYGIGRLRYEFDENKMIWKTT